METTNNEKEITLSYLLKILKKSVIWMLLVAIVFGALAAAYTAFLIKPKYRATANFWVNNASSDYDYASQAQVSAALVIAANCVELAYQELPAKEAIKLNDYELAKTLGYADENGEVGSEEFNACVAYVRGMITAGKSDETTGFYISVTSGSIKHTYATICALQEILPSVIFDLVGIKNNENNAPMIRPTTTVDYEREVVMVKDSPAKSFVVAALISSLVVFVLFFILSLLDTIVYSDKILRENFNHPIIGTIPNWTNLNSHNTSRLNKILKNSQKYKHSDLVLRDYTDRLLNPKAPFAVTEAFNTLRTNIIFSLAAAKNPVIAITSARSAEGKSLMSSNTAMSLSFLEKKVLLVECDMRCPSFSKVFSKNVSKGLSEYLAGMIDSYDEVIEKYDENLDIIFCGKIPPNPSELLSSERMSEVVSEWRKTYDYIILDMPPVCEVADAGVISTMVSGYVLTVRSDFSDVNEVRSAAAGLEAVNGNILGFILNDVNIKARGEYKNDYHKLYRKTATFNKNETFGG